LYIDHIIIQYIIELKINCKNTLKMNTNHSDSDNPNEYEIIQEWYKKKTITVSDLFQVNERYNRYLNRIVYWQDSQENDYSYIRAKIYEFVTLDNNASMLSYKFKLMKYIDGEILVMMNLCLMNDMEV